MFRSLENDAAVLKAYGWPPDLTESEIVSRLFEMYATLTAKARKFLDVAFALLQKSGWI